MKIKRIWVVLLAFVVLLFASCDKKTPVEGYLTEEQILEVVKGFSKEVDYSKYSYSGSMNFLDKAKEIDLPCFNIGKEKVKFTDSLEYYSSSCASYYLRMPLHITEENWTLTNDDGQLSGNSTRLKIESTLLTISDTLDKVYYYVGDNGDFIIRTFGANKSMIIDNKNTKLNFSGKWNCTITYDKNGYLKSEKFETINAHKKPDSETCYGEATYTFFAE